MKILRAVSLFVFSFFFFYSVHLSACSHEEQKNTIHEAVDGERAFFGTCACLDAPCPKQMEPAFHQALHTLLKEGGRLFLVVDGSYDQSLVKSLRNWKKESLHFLSFFSGTHLSPIQDEAPYLVEVDEHSPFLEQALQKMKKANQKVLLFVSHKNTEDIVRHLQKWLRATTPDEKELYNFRFYAPRVLEVYLPELSLQERYLFLGPIDHALIWSFTQNELSRWSNRPIKTPSLKITPRQMQSFSKLALDLFKEKGADFIKDYFPKAYKEQGRETVIRTIQEGISRAAAYRLFSEREVIDFVVFMYAYGSDFDTDRRYPWVQEILNDHSLSNDERLKRLQKAFRTHKVKP